MGPYDGMDNGRVQARHLHALFGGASCIPGAEREVVDREKLIDRAFVS